MFSVILLCVSQTGNFLGREHRNGHLGMDITDIDMDMDLFLENGHGQSDVDTDADMVSFNGNFTIKLRALTALSFYKKIFKFTVKNMRFSIK